MPGSPAASADAAPPIPPVADQRPNEGGLSGRLGNQRKEECGPSAKRNVAHFDGSSWSVWQPA